MADERPLLDTQEPVTVTSTLSAKSESISLLDLLVILASRKTMILRIVAASAMVSVVVSFLLPAKYESTISIMTPQQNSSVSAALGAQLGSLSGASALASAGLGLKNPNDMYVGMLKGHFVEDAMVKRYDLMHEYKKKYFSDARKAFEDHTSVDGSGKDSLIHIAVEDHDPNRAAELANGYVDQFRILSQHLAITEASRRKLFFEQELERAKDNLAKAEEELKRTEQSTGLIQLDSQARALIESAGTIRAQIAAKEVQIQSMRTYSGAGNVELMQAEQELSGLRGQLAKLTGAGGGESNELMVPKGQIPQAGLEYVRRLRDVKYYEKIFEILSQQYELAALDEAKEGAIVQIVDPAMPADRRSFPKRGLIVIGSTVAGFFLAIVIAFLDAAWMNAQRDPETVSKMSRLRTTLFTRGA